MQNIVENKVAVIGKGMIGTSFAVLFTGNGIPVTLLTRDAQTAREKYRECYAQLIEQDLVTEAQAQKCETLVEFVGDYQGISDANVVFECVSEQLEVKQSVYALVEQNVKRLIAIASASSAYSPVDLAKNMRRKDALLVAHPWNPPHLVPCVEIVPSADTAGEAVEVVTAILKKAKREPVFMKKAAPGFVANRIQHAMIREALHMVTEGIADPEDIDKAIRTSFAPRYTSIGLFEHMDNTGIDLAKNVEDYLFGQLGNETCACAFINERVQRGDLGVKTGTGVYEWTPQRIADLRRRAAQPYFTFFNWDLP